MSSSQVYIEISVPNLQREYGRSSPQTIYNWLHQLGITPLKNGRKMLITMEQKNLLDELAEYLSDKSHKSEDFLLSKNIGGQTMTAIKKMPEEPHDLLAFTRQIVDMLQNDTEGGTLRDNRHIPLEKLYETKTKDELLLWYAESKIQISSKTLSDLIETKPPSYDFQRGSFTFRKSGKIGRMNSWRVEFNPLPQDDSNH